MKIAEKQSLKDLTWWKIGGFADYLCFPQSLDEVKAALVWAKEKAVPLTVIGGGSNILVSDLGVEGLVVCMRHFVGISSGLKGDRLEIDALAGTPKSELVKIFLKAKLAPALFLCGLPGDVGGGVVMNAGVSESIEPKEFCEIVDWIDVLGTDEVALRRYEKDQIEWHYRHSRGWQPGIVVRVGMSWPNIEAPEILNQVKQATKNRLLRQPLNQPSCGSVFKNPDGYKAGALIEQAGLKGFRVGGAEISAKHANFIVNVGNAKALDVDQLIKQTQKIVFDKFGVALQPEVKFIGRW